MSNLIWIANVVVIEQAQTNSELQLPVGLYSNLRFKLTCPDVREHPPAIRQVQYDILAYTLHIQIAPSGI
jgi:hypothetical protein